MTETIVPFLLTTPLSDTYQRNDESVASVPNIYYPHNANIIRPARTSYSACSPSHPASVARKQQSITSQPSHTSYDSHSSIYTWLDRTGETLKAAQKSDEQCDQANRRKRKRTASPDLEQPEPRLNAPLTRKALKQHLASTMSPDQSTLTPQTLTPTKSSSTNASSYQTPTNPSNTSKPSLPPSEVRYHMEAHRMFIDKGVLDKPEVAGFRNHVMSVADTERPSGRKPESEKRWQKRMKKIHVHNEATMLDHVLPLLIKVARRVPVHAPPTQEEASMDEEVYHSLWEDFEDCGLDWTQDREFARTFLPNSYHAIGYEEQIAKTLAKERGMKNPKPDRAYGLAIDHIPSPDNQTGLLRDDTRAFLNAIPGLQHVFFLIEGVRSAGDLRKAMNQACRGGTVAVRVQRLLLEAIGEDTMREGLDSQTYVYTATIDDSQISFWVNFAVVKTVSPSGQKIVDYHMEHVYSYGFRSPDAELYLRRVCHNILDWGVRGRREMLQERCSKMYESERLAIDRDIAELQAQAATAVAAQEQASGNKKRKLVAGSVSQKGC